MQICVPKIVACAVLLLGVCRVQYKSDSRVPVCSIQYIVRPCMGIQEYAVILVELGGGGSFHDCFLTRQLHGNNAGYQLLVLSVQEILSADSLPDASVIKEEQKNKLEKIYSDFVSPCFMIIISAGLGDGLRCLKLRLTGNKMTSIVESSQINLLLFISNPIIFTAG